MNRTVHTRFTSFAHTRSLRMLILLATLLVGSVAAIAQSTAFSYQGRLNDGANAANGTYEIQFKLFDAVTGGTQVGTTFIPAPAGVVVTNGAFTVTLDFGATAFPGADRWLEISVKPPNGAAFTTLTPRQRVTATPYAIKSLSADGLSASCNGCVTGTQIGSLPATSTNYIQNGTALQANSNFNISGNGIFGGRVGIQTGGTAPTQALDVNGTIGVFDFNPRQLSAGISTEVGAQLIQFGVNSDKFGALLNPAIQGGYFRVDTRAGQGGLFQFRHRTGTLLLGIEPDGTMNGNGSGLTNLSAANIAAGTLAIARGGTGITAAPTAAGQFLRSTGANTWAVGSIAASDLPTGSANYIQNGTTQQANSNFNISGNGIIGGNVGIGTLAPTRKLTVFSGQQGISQTNGTVEVGTYISADNSEAYIQTYSNHALSFSTNNSTAYLTLATSGKFGIGTRTPNNLLTVNGNASFGGIAASVEPLEVQGSGAGISYYDRALGGGPRRWVLYANNTAFKFFNGANGDVASMNEVGTLVLNGCIVATNIACASDARLKEQITGLRYGLRELMQLRPVSWQWKDRATTYLPMGLIAQEVEPVLPELILHPNGPSGTLGLNYSGLVPIMIKATQEQQVQLEQLKAENDNLKTRLAVLEQMMQQLKGQAENQQPKQEAKQQ